MDELEQLAAAIPAAAHAKALRLKAARRRRLLILATICAAVVVAGVIYLLIPPRAPDFTIERETTGGELVRWSAWAITNKIQEPLTINRVVLNGEFSSPIAVSTGLVFYPDKDAAFPVTLTIGETRWFLERDPRLPETYQKSVEFVDIFSNRGHFRYTPDAGLKPAGW